MIRIAVRDPDWRAGGALCIGRWSVWDPRPDEDYDHLTASAIAQCQRCPMLQTCGDWLDSLQPWQKPTGVTAGRLRKERGERAPHRRQAG